MMASATPLLIYRHNAFLDHDTGGHPENRHRLDVLYERLDTDDTLAFTNVPDWHPAGDDAILRAHDKPLLQRLLTLDRIGGGAIDADTIVSPGSLTAARMAAGAGIDAIDRFGTDESRLAAVLGRPPGHHATRTRSMGFCLLNTAAIAAQYARAHGSERVVILDWDVHHGNGTQDIFYDDPSVLVCSSHRYDGWYFPGTGAPAERGSGDGVGATVNAALRAGDGDMALLDAWTGHILPHVAEFQPDLVILSAGYDAHRQDPLGGLQVSTGGFGHHASTIAQAIRSSGNPPVLLLLEGGYDPDATAESVLATLHQLSLSL